MKRKIVTLSLAACAAACLCFGLAACGGGEKPDDEDDVQPTESFELLADGTYELTKVEWGWDNKNGHIVIPEEYTIPSEHEGIPVTSVASQAINFYGEEAMLSVTIPAGIRHLGYGSIQATTVYWNAVSVEDKEHDNGYNSIVTNANTVVFGEEVKRVPAHSFGSDYIINLKSVTLSDSIEEIGDYAFVRCYQLQNIHFPEHLTTIGDYAFYGSGLTSVTIPDSVTSIGVGAFSYCDELTSITVPFIGGSREENRQFSYICEKDFSTETPLSVTVTGGTDVPKSAFSLVEVFDDIWGFSIYEYIESITLPETVTSIGDYAFTGCSGLTSVTIPDGVTSIGDDAFELCFRLTSIYYTGDIGGWCGISGLYNLMSYGDLSKNLYFNDELMTSITIPDGVTSIGDWTFSGCSSLTSVTIPDSVTSIGSSAFSGCSSLTSVTIPDSVTSIGSYAFYGCSNLESITLPFIGASKDGTNDTHFGYIFGASSFTDNSSYAPESLKTVIITGGSSIGGCAFSECRGLTSVTIPDSVTSIGDYAFTGCSGLTSVTIGNGVTSIGMYAFSGCSGLTNIYYTGDIGGWCGISELDNLMSYGASDRKLYINGTEITGELIIPNGVTTIPAYAFYNCSGLTSITIPDSVTSIGNYAFSGCPVTNVYYKGTLSEYFSLNLSFSSYRLYIWSGAEYAELTTVTILPDQIDFLRNIASIKEITVQYDEDRQISALSLSGMNWLEKINLEYFEDEIEIYNASENVQIKYGYNCQVGTSDGFGYAIRGNVASLTSYTGNAERIILPAQIEGVAITKLGSIFKNNTTVKEVVIPEGYTEIADETFYGCTALEIVYIPSTITKMGENVFYNNNMVYNAPSNLPFAYDGSYILSGIYTSLSLSASTGNWTDKAYFIHKNSHFDADSKIIYEYGGGIEEPRILRYSGTDSTVTVPATIENIAVKEIYYCAFYGIQTLNSVTLSEGIESIGKSAFEGCSALQNVSLPQSLTTIAAGAFKDCSNLTTITIPRAVKMIGDHVFTGCSALASISFELPTGWISYTFTDTGANPDSAQSHEMSNTAECVTMLRDTYAERMFVNSGTAA